LLAHAGGEERQPQLRQVRDLVDRRPARPRLDVADLHGSNAPGSVAVAPGLLRLHELREDAARRVRVDEGDEMPAQAPPGALVDELGARGAKLLEGSVEVADGVADVMKARAAPLEEARDRALRVDR